MKKKTVIKICVIFTAFAILTVFVIVGIDKSIKLEIDAVTTNMCEKEISEAINEAVAETGSVNELITVEKDADGVISMINVDNSAVNSLSTAVTQSVIRRLSKIRTLESEIPLGSILFSRVFSGTGPDVKLNIYTTASATVDYEYKFTETGINQTLFTLYVVADTDIKTRTGFFVHNTNVTRKISVCNIIIVGRVPQTYANLLEGGDFLNLVP